MMKGCPPPLGRHRHSSRRPELPVSAQVRCESCRSGLDFAAQPAAAAIALYVAVPAFAVGRSLLLLRAFPFAGGGGHSLALGAMVVARLPCACPPLRRAAAVPLRNSPPIPPTAPPAGAALASLWKSPLVLWPPACAAVTAVSDRTAARRKPFTDFDLDMT